MLSMQLLCSFDLVLGQQDRCGCESLQVLVTWRRARTGLEMGKIMACNTEGVPGSALRHQPPIHMPWEETQESLRDDLAGKGQLQGHPVTGSHQALTDDASLPKASVFMPWQPLGNLDHQVLIRTKAACVPA